jgi:class 3 adenylate cyclase/tetratricopeptide (TPR) repeat protein
MEYRVLGPLEVLDGSGEKLALGGAMQQSVLASLLLRAGQTVALERLIDDLWDEPPETAARTIQAYVSRLRHELPQGAIESRPGGYMLVLDGAELDLEMFGQQAGKGHAALAAGDYKQAAGLLRGALALWRGPALAGLNSKALRREAQRLEELRLSVLEERAEADLGCGRHGDLVAELTAVVNEHPFRERPRAQLMRALYHSGRPGDALALYRDGRRMLVEELGMEPGQELRELEQAILRQDAELEGPELRRSWVRGQPVPPLVPEPPRQQAPPREVRKTVTILFCDIVDSTGQGESTDPEVVRSRLARFFEQMKAIVERHGGTVEKFIGDAVMAVFGVPRAHEDDALRACRAALEMRDALPTLGVEGRIGLMTGEVVTGTEERLATGDAVNVAARLERTAGAGEVLIGRPTFELAREALEVETLEPLELKGKTRPVDAYRLKAVHEPGPRLAERPFVGREQELTTIESAWQRALVEQRCELFTIVGEAGVGKSRLVAELLGRVDATVVRGRCLPYGEGITYWPVVEVLKPLGMTPTDEAAAAAIRSLLGETDTQTSAEEIAWAVRKTFEQAASERPLAVVFDDVHWGEETFLDLVEHVALLSTVAPILLVCMARPELLQRRPQWPVTLRLEPLPADDVDELIPPRIDAELRERIARAAGGNPLFITEMLAMTGDAQVGVVVPPTLQALLAARLDQLEPPERGVLERGAVEGEIFHRGAVQALAPDELQVTPRLAALVRKELIRPEAPQLPGEDAFRFRHLLFRDAAYEALAKATRAELHERYARWLEERGGALVELDEILGYHLEQAYRYRRELGLDDDGTLAAAARRRLTLAGVQARVRGDRPVLSLLERAAALVPAGAIDLPLEMDLLDALIRAGRGREALDSARSLADRAAAAGDRIAELCARIKETVFRVHLEPEGATEELAVILDEAVPEFEGASNDVALHVAYEALGHVSDMRAKMDALRDAFERAAYHGRRAGRPYEYLGYRAMGRLSGTTPVSELLAWLDEQDARGVRHHWLDLARSTALAMVGRSDEARTIMTAVRAKVEAFGTAPSSGFELALVLGQEMDNALLAGDPAAAAESGSEAMPLYDEFGERSNASTVAGLVGQALYELERLDEAEAWAGRAAELGASDDALTQMLWRQVKAKVVARRGEHADAERVAREAIAIGEETDLLNGVAAAYADLGEVLTLAGRAEEAAAALAEALARYERKESVVMAQRVRARLAELQRSETTAERA